MPSEGLFDALYARGPVAAQTDGRAWLAAMLDVEAALARACAAEGLIPAPSAEAIAQDKQLQLAYLGHGHHKIIDNSTDFMGKMLRVEDNLCAFVC